MLCYDMSWKVYHLECKNVFAKTCKNVSLRTYCTWILFSFYLSPPKISSLLCPKSLGRVAQLFKEHIKCAIHAIIQESEERGLEYPFFNVGSRKISNLLDTKQDQIALLSCVLTKEEKSFPQNSKLKREK